MMRWAIIYEDDHAWLEFTEDHIKQALIEAFKQTQDIERAFELVKQSLRQEAARH